MHRGVYAKYNFEIFKHKSGRGQENLKSERRKAQVPSVLAEQVAKNRSRQVLSGRGWSGSRWCLLYT